MRDQAEEVKRIPPWTKQITVRGIVASVLIGIIYSVIVTKLNLTTGLVPNLNVSAALLAYVIPQSWIKILEKAKFTSTTFTKQENTIIQTCAVACYSTAVGAGVDTKGNTPGSHKEPSLDWMIGFLFIVSFVGLLALVPLRKVFSNLVLDIWFTGMICSHLVNLSLLLGAVLSWGVFISISLLLGDGLYNFVRTLCFTFRNIYFTLKTKRPESLSSENKNLPLDELQRNEIFTRESIPFWVAFIGYLIFSLISIIVIPLMFPALKWYYVLVAYIFAPALSFCNAYGAGLTDLNMAYNYGKVALFVLAALSEKENGVVAGLIGCGLIKSMVSISSDLMHDFKTSYLTLTSPRSMLLSQAIGTAIGCVYKAPYALIYRNMAILGVEGFSPLPHHCVQLCYVRDIAPERVGKWIPLPMAMAVPFLVGASFAIDMAAGSLVVYVWHKLNSKKADLMVPAVASGLICGDGLWILPSALLALLKVRSPICMAFSDGQT
ncbi:unnamed protein product [Withania somnifera]